MSDTAKIVVDGREVEVPRDFTLLQACEAAGAEVPRFCYHERLSIAGNCRMCLVDWVGAPKPIASCAQTVGEMRPNPDGTPPNISTTSERAVKARNGVMEFLLINHPLDCPICDQGGECDLQDQAMAFGRGGSRYDENKRAVDDKNMGPLIKTVMTRCIQCTRCVRFAAEVAGVEELGLANRGENAEITTYLEQSMTSELSGNVIDLCPVGALTSKPYAFNARPWELRKTETVDVMDALGSAIRVDSRGMGVLRILPRVNEEINEEWISDKTRFVWDGLGRQRLDSAYVREHGKLRAVSPAEAISAVVQALSVPAEQIGAIAGDLTPVEGMKAAKDLLSLLGSTSFDCRQSGAKLGVDAEGTALPRESWLFNSTIMGIDEADAILLVGCNPRVEAPVLNARIRKNWLHRDVPVGVIGPDVDLSYDAQWLGDGAAALTRIKGGGEFREVLDGAVRPMIILGEGALCGADGHAVLRTVSELAGEVGAFGSADGWNGFNVLHSAAARVGGLDLGFVPGSDGLDTAGMIDAAGAGNLSVLLLLGADEIETSRLGEATVIYLGSHGDAGAHRADIILPVPAYTEQSGTFVNTEGRVQRTTAAVARKGEARAEWEWLRAISEGLGKTLGYNNLEQIREALGADNPIFRGLDFAPNMAEASVGPFSSAGTLTTQSYPSAVANFYLSNPIARASRTMAECAEQLRTSTPVAAE